MRLLRRTGAGALFADGEFHRERHFGLTKSFLAFTQGVAG
jgi:hypothetical protein